MRLYKKIQPLLAGVTADKTHKAVLLVNSTSGYGAPCLLNIKNYDGSVSGITFDIAASPSGSATVMWSIVPFSIESWTDLSTPGSSVTPIVYLLY